jgi:hypothetical protein
MARITPPSAGTTPEAQQSLALINSYNDKVREIRESDRYTPEGQRETIAALHRDVKKEVDTLLEQQSSRRTERVNTLRQQLFGNKALSSSDAISLRDAQERVASLTEEPAALKLLDQAELGGDTVMARAVLQKAIDEKWSGIAHKYVEYHPAFEGNLEEYWALTAGGLSSGSFENTMSFYLPAPALR